MSHDTKQARVVPSANVREFFRQSVDVAIERQRLEAEDHTVHYVVNMLTLFTRAEELYGSGPERRLPPLAAMLAEAIEAPSSRDSDRVLQRLGDVALFMAGFFPDYLARRPVDVDYYIHMGGSAYSTLADRSRGSRHGSAFADIFAELSDKFAAFVEVLGEIADLGRRYTPRDILRLYELWIATGSPRARDRLDALGVQVSPSLSSSRQH
ncbi:MAG: hypothetical protein PVG91_09340 [Gammaproteobacteria bacterium]